MVGTFLGGLGAAGTSVTPEQIAGAGATGRDVLAAETPAAGRTALSLGALATQSTVDPTSQLSAAVPVAAGGTGAATAPQSRVNLAVQDGPRDLPVFDYATATSAVVAAYRDFTASAHAITGRTTTLTLVAVGNVTAGGLTGTLTLVDTADDSVVATLTWTETVPTVKQAAVALPGGAKVYRVRVSCAGADPADPTQFAQFGGAVFRLTWS